VFVGTVRPVAEIRYEREFDFQETFSGLIGAIWKVKDDLAFDFGVREAWVNTRPETEIRAGLTFALAPKEKGSVESSVSSVMIALHRAAPGRPSLAGALCLDRRTRHRTVRAEHAAIARFWPQRRAAAAALVKELAGVGRHGFRLGCSTMRTGDDGLEHHGSP